MIDRRSMFALLGGCSVITWPPAQQAARAQNPARIYRLGHLSQAPDSVQLTREFTLPELAKHGFVEGRNLRFLERTGPADALPRLARELLTDKPDAIIAIGGAEVRAAREATDTVPIVMFAADPVGLGLTNSFARPDGNVTGIANMVSELAGKRLALLLEAAPTAQRIAVLLKPTSPLVEQEERELRAVTSAKAGVELLVHHAEGPSDYQNAFAAMRAGRAEALVIGNDPRFYADRALLANLAAEAGLPTICEWATMARAGCLLGYGANQAALRHRMAFYVASILRGATPAELPFEQPTVFEFVVNLKTAKQVGLSIPPTILLRADEVIE